MNCRFGRTICGRGGIFGGHDEGFPPVMLQVYKNGKYKIVIYNEGMPVAVLGPEVHDNPVISASFELTTTGCGQFSISLASVPIGVEITHKTRFDFYLFGDKDPWYSGYITERPMPGNTTKKLEYSGFGYVAQLDTYLVSGTYENMDISLIADDIIRGVEKQTGIRYRESKIYSTGFTVTKIVWENEPAVDAMKTLEELAVNFVYGVDERRDFYFRPLKTDINERARLHVGKHLTEFLPTENTDDVINYIIAEGGVDGVTTIVQDAISQTLYGIKKDVLRNSSISTLADLQEWANNQLEALKDPVQKATVKGVQLTYLKTDGALEVRKLIPGGKIQITSYDGKYVYEYPLEKAKYSISSDGITFEPSLGEKYNKFTKYLLDLERGIRNQELLN